MFVFLPLSVLPLIVTAHPTSQPPVTYFDTLHSRDDQTCVFTGNPDLYGPGIRVGIYTQTLAVFITKNLVLSQAHVVRDSLTVFSLALLIVSIRFAANTSTTNAVECFLLLQILSWNLVTGVRARTSYVMSVLRNRPMRILGAEAINVAAAGLHAWFWFVGMDRMEGGQPDAACTAKVFFFAETRLRGWFRVLMQCTTVMAFVEHSYDLGCRAVGTIGRGWWRAKEEEMRRAMEEYKTWKMRKDDGNAQIGSCDGKACALQEKEVPSRPGSSTDISLKITTSNDNASIHTSNTSASDTTEVDDESISAKVNRIKTQLPADKPSPVFRTTSNVSHPTHPPTSPPSPPSIPLFSALLTSEAFFAHCTSVSTPATASFRQHHPYLYRAIQLLNFVPCPQNHSHPVPPSLPTTRYTQCLRALFHAALTLRLPRQTILLSTHLLALRTLDPINGPHQLHAVLTHPDLPPLHILQLASDITLSLRPPMNAWIRYYQAGVDLTLHLFVIVQIELTIRYNRITGLGGIENVGQLIPLLVGVGGLLLVVARGVEGVCKGERVWEDGAGKEEGRAEWLEFVAVFEEWKGMVGEGGKEEDGSGVRVDPGGEGVQCRDGNA